MLTIYTLNSFFEKLFYQGSTKMIKIIGAVTNTIIMMTKTEHLIANLPSEMC